MLAIEIKRLRSYLHEPDYDSLITLYGVFGVASLTRGLSLGIFGLGSVAQELSFGDVPF